MIFTHGARGYAAIVELPTEVACLMSGGGKQQFQLPADRHLIQLPNYTIDHLCVGCLDKGTCKGGEKFDKHAVAFATGDNPMVVAKIVECAAYEPREEWPFYLSLAEPTGNMILECDPSVTQWGEYDIPEGKPWFVASERPFRVLVLDNSNQIAQVLTPVYCKEHDDRLVWSNIQSDLACTPWEQLYDPFPHKARRVCIGKVWDVLDANMNSEEYVERYERLEQEVSRHGYTLESGEGDPTDLYVVETKED